MECLRKVINMNLSYSKCPIASLGMPTANQLLQAFNQASNFVESCRFIDNGGERKETLSEGNILT
jgi:hypothetical protein